MRFRIPKQVLSEVNDQGFIISNQHMHYTSAKSLYIRSNSTLGVGSSGKVNIAQCINNASGDPESVGQFMTVKVFNTKTRYNRAIKSFDLQNIPYDCTAIDINKEYYIFRPFVYGDVLSSILFDANDKKQSLPFQVQLNMAVSILDEISTRFEQKKLVHRALKPENIIWDAEENSAKVIDEEDVTFAEDDGPGISSMVHTSLYRPPEINVMPNSSAADRYSVGIVLAEVFLDSGIKRQTLSQPVLPFGHIARYFSEKIDASSTEGLIRKEIQNLNSRLANKIPELRPALWIMKQVLEHLKVLNSTGNAAQKAVLVYVQGKKFEKKYFPLSIEAKLLEFYQTATEVPSESDLDKQVEQLISATLLQSIDPDICRDLSRHLISKLENLVSENSFSEIESLIFPEKDSNRPLPPDIMIDFLLYFIEHPNENNYLHKLDQLFIQKLNSATDLENLGLAYNNLEYRMLLSPDSHKTIYSSLSQSSEQLKRKVMTLYMKGVQGILSAGQFIQLLFKHRDKFEENFHVSSGISNLLSFDKKDETTVLYNRIIESKQSGPYSKEVNTAAETLIKKYTM